MTIEKSCIDMLHHVIKTDPIAAAKLKSMGEFTCRLTLTHWCQVTIDMSFKHGFISLGIPVLQEPDVEIKGSPLALFEMARSTRMPHFDRQQVLIKGDAQKAKALEQWFKRFDVNWAICLEPVMGAHAAHGLSMVFKDITESMAEGVGKMINNMSDYIAHETSIIANQSQAHQFAHEVQMLRLKLDRIDARMSIIEES